AAGGGRRTGGAPPENLRVGEQRGPEVAPDEAWARGTYRKHQSGGIAARLEELGLDAPEQMALPLGLAAMCERDDDIEPLTQERAELVLRLTETAGRQRRPLGVERVLLTLRQRVELSGARERERSDTLLLPYLAHVIGLPDEIGRAVDDRHEILEQLGLEHFLVVV